MEESSLPPVRLPFLSRPHLVRVLLLLLFLAICSLWFSSRALLAADFLPHRYCLAGNGRLLWTTVLGDLFIFVSYVAISGTLVCLIGRAGPSLPYQGFFWAFGLLLLSCGVTHFIEIVTVWQPVYWLAAAAKILTAVSSVGTAIVLAVAAEDIISFVRTARQATPGGQERFRALCMATPLAVVSFDLDGLITSWNPAAEKTFGFRESDVLGKTNPIIPQEYRAEHKSLLSTLDGCLTSAGETTGQRLDGSRIPVRISAAPLFGSDGKQIGVMAAIQDKSERKKLQLEFEEKTAILLAVTQALSLYLETGDWKLAGRQLLSIAIEQTRSEYGFLAVVVDRTRIRILAHDRSTWDAQIHSELAAHPRQPAPENAHLNLQSLHDLFSEVILSGHTVIVNQPLPESRSIDLLPGHTPLQSFLGVPLYKGNEVTGLIGVANREGGYSGGEWNSLGAMSGATGILYDHYRQSLTRAAFAQKQEALKDHVRQSQNLDSLARVAGGFAHDFNNILMILSGASELLERSLGPESLSRVYVDQIQQSTAKAAAITRQLLAFSRKQVLDLRPMDLHAALFAAQSMLSHFLGSAIELTFSPQAASSWICSDLPQIVQVILNLCDNSRDAMSQGGQLQLSTRNTDKLPATAPVAAKNRDWIVLAVRDSGSGMNKTTLAQIFEPFFTTKPVGKGTGLGLSTVYGVVRQSSGWIQVQSEPGLGACFELYFPVVAAPETFPLSFEPVGSPLPQSATILLVDDETALVHAIGEFLRESGFIVLDAFSSQNALDLAKEYPGRIDVLVTDIVMPALRGPELHRQIIEFQPEIQVLFMSGFAEGLPDMKLPPGALFLQKPFRFSVLLESLRQLQAGS